MKKIGTYTVRGSIFDPDSGLADGSEEKIQLFDGRFDTAYKITSFKIATGDASDPDITGRVTTEPGLDSSIQGFWNWSDQRQIAWAAVNGATDVFGYDFQAFVDEDNLIVEDCFVSFRFASANTNRVNYMITFEKYDITDSLGVLTMIRNRSQGESTA